MGVPLCCFTLLVGWNGKDPWGILEAVFKDGRTFVSLGAWITDQGGPLYCLLVQYVYRDQKQSFTELEVVYVFGSMC